MKTNTNNIIIYGAAFAIVILAKTAYKYATNDALLFILKPLSKLISIVTNKDFLYANDIGFYFETLNITIDKSCSGINFWCISFLVFIILLHKVCKTYLQKFLLFPVVILATYLLTLFANTSRILTSLFISKQTDFNYPWLHQAEGVFIYLSFLIIFYTLLNRSLLKYHTYNEKLT